jgi:hypothetical protein
MKNLLFFVLGAGAAYYLLQMQKKKCKCNEVLKEELKATIKAQNPGPSMHPNIAKNRATFQDLRAVYNDSEAATVAPSIKAPIGIF